jgi:hypothetical protein
MSFRLFIYYCAVCGAWAAFFGWALGYWLTEGPPKVVGDVGVAQDAVVGLCLGLLVALALGLVDGLWNLTGYRYDRLLWRGGAVAVLGGLGGAVGGGLGGALDWLTRLDWLRPIGWALTGLLVGTAVGVYDLGVRRLQGERSAGAARKLRNGFLGGLIGGGLGGLLFVAVRVWLGRALGKPPEQVLAGTCWGLTAVGTSIGLFVGLAQVILKEAWLRVESGRRVGRELILTKDETTIGRAEACDVGLFGDAGVDRLHARITVRDGDYVLSDAGSKGGTYLNDNLVATPTRLHAGDAIRVGGSVLRFHERPRKRK